MRTWRSPPLPPRWTSSAQPLFVARREELAWIDEAWADALRGSAGALFLSGDAGSGKSRLVAEACTRLHARGAAVLSGACIQELSAAFEPLDQVVRQLLAGLDDEQPDAATGTVRLLREVFDRSPARERDEQDAAPDVGQMRLYDGVVELLGAASDARPLVIAIDDLHWAEPTAIRLLAHLVRRTVERADGARVLILGTLRAGPLERSEALGGMLAELQSSDAVRTRELAPLNPGEIADYLAAQLAQPSAGLGHSAGTLYALTGGNPFLLRESWRAVVEAETGTAGQPIAVPQSIGELFQSRLARFDEQQRTVLALAAVLGLEPDLGELLAVSAAPPAVPRPLVFRTVELAVSLGLLEAPRGRDGRYRFVHAIARQLVLEAAGPTGVPALHARIAQTLERQFPAAPHRVQRLAHHYSAARSLGFGDRAVSYLIRASELADQRLAHEDAGRLFERAAECTSDAAERDSLRVQAARRWIAATDFAHARELCEQVIELAAPRTRVLAAIEFEEASWKPGLPGHRAVDILTAALGGIPPDDGDPLRIEALGALSRAIAFTGDIDAAEALVERAIALARRSTDPTVLPQVLRASITQSLRPQGLAARRERARELVALGQRPHSDALGAGANFLSVSGYVLGDGQGMLAAEERVADCARHWGGYWQYWAVCARFGRMYIAGRLTDAAALCAQLAGVELGFRSDLSLGVNALQSYMVRRERGRLDFVRGLVTGEESPTSRWAPGLLALYCELEMREPARRLLRWLLEREAAPARRAAGARASGQWPAQLLFMVEAALWLGDRRAAAELRPLLAEYEGLNVMSGYYVAIFGSADRYLGQLDALCAVGDPGARFEAALALDERTGAPLHAAYTLAATARFLRQYEPHSPRAAALAERAEAIARPAGLVRVLRMLQPGGPGEQAASAGHRPDGLTARELEVIALLADGRSNRQIAGALVISEHTAANHVRSILVKIGANNRTQAAKYARENRLA
ncbi:ATP-binding protein [Microterricola pindariensis]|uniref:HTH luxR-type domain-containing protein n=1 Tax=Microterricola pindariensis TaxID=478010 RepID=A0ABX5AXE4_9MICO|nr:LuxR family transcriptional regulator [Microterricola pindariensis]PPL19572.1 hypothetical protein GY24_05135 [Microterricola pindariensis]